jgi:hypothetical protein
VLLPNAYCINPLNWTTDETPADKTLNLGAVFFNAENGNIDREIPHYAGAGIDETKPEGHPVFGFMQNM